MTQFIGNLLDKMRLTLTGGLKEGTFLEGTFKEERAQKHKSCVTPVL